MKGPCSPFPDLFKSRDEHYPHSPTPMGQGSGPSSNHRPLHSEPPPQEPGAGMAVGGCLWSSAGLQTHVNKGREQGRGAVSAHGFHSVEKPRLRVYPHAHTNIDTHTQGLKSTTISPTHTHTVSRAQVSPLPGVSTVRLAGASTWPRALRARQR